MMFGRTTTFLALLLSCALLQSCIDDKTKAGSDVPEQHVSISITPATTSLPTGGTLLFSALVKGTTPGGTGNTTVSWRVDEGPAGGHITSQGLYTAPAVPGIFHVTAQSQVDNTKTDSAAITVSSILDASFGQGGKVTTGFAETAEINALARQPDGKIVAGGFALNGAKNSFALARYLSDGSLDASFGEGGVVLTALGDSQIKALAVQPDGRILAVGFAQGGFDIVNTVPTHAFAMARYLPDGTLDTSFGTNGMVTQVIDGNSEIHALEILPGDKILVAGFVFDTKTQDKNFALARYLPDGSPDPSFGTAGAVTTDIGGSDDEVAAMFVQLDGQIVVGGFSVSGGGGGNNDFALARYTADGLLDTTFGTLGITVTDAAGGASDQINALALLPDGRFLAGGLASNGTDNDFALARYTADGLLDTTFGTLGTTVTDVAGGASDQINGLAVSSSGEILAGGLASNGTDNDFALARYSTGGVILATATTNVGGGNADEGHAVLLRFEGATEKLVVGGFAATPLGRDFGLAQYNATGALTLDTASFGNGGIATSRLGGSHDALNDMAIYIAVPDQDKIVVAGTSSSNFALARYSAEGGLDPSFGGDGRVETPIGSGADRRALGHAVAIYSSGAHQGKIVVGGLSFNTVASTDDDFTLVRYNADGTLDTSFGSTGIVTTSLGPAALGNDDAINALAIQPDNKLLALGYGAVPVLDTDPLAACAVTGTRKDIALFRYNTDGTLDTTFGAGGKVATSAAPVVPCPLLPNTPLVADTRHDSFGQALALQADGKILVLGHGAQTNGGDVDLVVIRYLTNGTLDTSFDPVGQDGIVSIDVGGAEERATAIALQADGRILVAGTALTGDAAKFILARLLPDGSLDSSFGTGGVVSAQLGGLESQISALSLQADGKILVAGFTFSARNKRDFALARYSSNGVLDPSFGVGGIEISPFSAEIDEIHSLGLQSDGKIVAAGTRFDEKTLNSEFHLARYTP